MSRTCHERLSRRCLAPQLHAFSVGKNGSGSQRARNRIVPDERLHPTFSKFAHRDRSLLNCVVEQRRTTRWTCPLMVGLTLFLAFVGHWSSLSAGIGIIARPE